MAGARVVGMCMRDDGTINRPPGVDVEIARRAVQAGRTFDDQVGIGKSHVEETRSIASGGPRDPQIHVRHPRHHASTQRAQHAGTVLLRGVDFFRHRNRRVELR